jgi:transglutaminase-like putative cysteine protease
MGDRSVDHLLRMLELAGLIFLQALPFALVLFFFFPRYHGTLTLVLNDPTIGLTDTVAPGSIAKLSQDDSEAMYVKFDSGLGSVPLPESMYWRALVLWDYHAGIWTPGSMGDRYARNQPEVPANMSGAVLQEITVSRHNQRWLFALDLPVTKPINASESTDWAALLEEHTVQLAQPLAKVDHKVRYTVYSTMSPLEEDLRAEEQARALQRDKIDPQIIALAKDLHQGLTDDQVMDYVYAVVHYFRHNHFVYTTEPGPQGPDWLKYFLFQSKRGFCEHYASAFAVLMRLQGVPARLVTGYLGGDYNPYDDTYTIYQSYAHAWDEIWIADKNQPPGGIRGHWMRIDPTALITSVEETGAMGTAKGRDRTAPVQMAIQSSSFIGKYLPQWAKDDLKEVKLRREEVETNWDNMVLSYNPETQERLAQKLGFTEAQGVGLMLLACLLAGALCLFIFKRWTRPKEPITPVENLYAVFCRSMAQRGIPRAAWEGPLAYTERVAEAFPDDRQAIQRVGNIVATVRYGPTPVDPTAPENLKSLLNLLAASQVANHSRE